VRAVCARTASRARPREPRAPARAARARASRARSRKSRAPTRTSARPTRAPYLLHTLLLPSLRTNEYRGIKAWDKLPEATVCHEVIYRQTSSWIRTEYKYEYKAGENRSLALLTQKKYVRNLIWDAYYKYKDGPHKAFFDCLEAGKGSRSWLLSMEAEIERELTSEAFQLGKQLVESSVALYPEDLAEVIRAYALLSSSVGANAVVCIMKKAVRTTRACARMHAARSLTHAFLRLHAMQALNMHKTAAGRPGETSLICIELMTYKKHFRCTYSSWAQPKVAKHKGVLLLAGNGRHHCSLNNLADFLASGIWRSKDMTEYSGNTLFLFSDLHEKADPGGTLGDYIKGMSQESALAANKFVAPAVTGGEFALAYLLLLTPPSRPPAHT